MANLNKQLSASERAANKREVMMTSHANTLHWARVTLAKFPHRNDLRELISRLTA